MRHTSTWNIVHFQLNFIKNVQNVSFKLKYRQYCEINLHSCYENSKTLSCYNYLSVVNRIYVHIIFFTQTNRWNNLLTFTLVLGHRKTNDEKKKVLGRFTWNVAFPKFETSTWIPWLKYSIIGNKVQDTRNSIHTKCFFIHQTTFARIICHVLKFCRSHTCPTY